MDPKSPSNGMLFAPGAGVSNYSFPGANSKPTPQPAPLPLSLDDHIVPSEDGPYEMIRGEKVLVMPSKPEHADAQVRVAVAMDLYLHDDYVAAVEMLTRVDEGSDFATDVSVRKKGIDPRTGDRYLEELSIEVVNEQAPKLVQVKAHDLVRRGVRRVFAIFVKTGKISEWSQNLERFVPMNDDGTFDDPVLVRPMVVRALVDRTLAHVELVRTLEKQKHPEIQRIRQAGLDDGHKTGLKEGLKTGLKTGLIDLCEVFDISLDKTRRGYIDQLDVEALNALREQIKRSKCWPD